jgi:hypothetical protein
MRWLSIALVSMLAACGGSSEDDGGGSSGLDPDERVVTLDDTEVGVMCDWVSGQLGGYGHEFACENGQTVRTQASREECVSSTRDLDESCPVTVTDYEDCTNALDGDLCGLLSEPACLPLFECL